MTPTKAYSAFAGIGGFELGFCRAGVPVQWVGFSEVNPAAIGIYQSHFFHHNYGDITSLDPSKLPGFDLLTAGFPCQAFSIMGRRQGFKDPRGRLFFHLARILHHKRPRVVLLENVKGLLCHARGETFRAILNTLSELGYDTEWQLLNSKDFGVPQHRVRLYLIGYRRGEPRSQVFPLAGTNRGNHWRDEAFVPKVVAVAEVSYGQLPNRGGRRIKKPGEPMFTLLSKKEHGVFNGWSIRFLTPLEYERLQGFPDHWTQSMVHQGRCVPVADSRRYQALGNAVTVPVVEAIARALGR